MLLKKEEIQKKSKKSKNNEKLKVSINKDDDNENHESPSHNYKGRESSSNLNFKHSINKKSQNNFRYNNIDELVVYNENPIQSSKDETNKEELDPSKIEYDFNICEVLGASIFKCCQSKELQIKYNLNEKANSILSSKLDIVLYVRNMILFDIMNETLLSVGYKDIMNFLSRPIISLKGKEENVFSIFYHGYKSSDFDKFYNGINDLSQKMNKAREEKELLALTDKHLNKKLISLKVSCN